MTPLSKEELDDLRSEIGAVTTLCPEVQRGYSEMVSADICRRLIATIDALQAAVRAEGMEWRPDKRGLAYMLWYLYGMSESVKYDFDMGHKDEAMADIPPRYWRGADTLLMNFTSPLPRSPEHTT